MNILLISRGIPSKKYPQLGCFELDQAMALKDFGHNVTMIAFDGGLGKRFKKLGVNQTFINGINCYEIFGFPSVAIRKFVNLKLGLFIESLFLKRLIKRIIKKNGLPDIIHAHYLPQIAQMSFIQNSLKIPFVGTEHLSSIVYTEINNPTKTVLLNSYKKLQSLITVSKHLHDKILDKYGFDSIICPNVLGISFITSKFNKKKSRKKLKLVTCGSLIPRKGYQFLLEALQKISISKDNWDLTIIGEGPLQKELLKQTKDLNLISNVYFVGSKNKEEIIEIFDNSDIFILPSLSETFGVVVIEALSRGLPCIVTECGGTNGLINKKNGLYVPIKNSNSIKTAIEHLYNNLDFYDPNVIREDCLNLYSPEIIANKLTNIYKETIINFNNSK